ncbi:MAG: AarF/ABC1/UbiB kinase family protein, partial [Prochlorothrix sp.]
FGKLSNDFVSLGFLAEDVNLEPIVPAFEQVFGQAIEMGVSRMDFKAVTDDLSGVMYRFPFRVPPYYALIIRSLVTLEGIALSVDPNFKILGAAYPYFARRQTWLLGESVILVDHPTQVGITFQQLLRNQDRLTAIGRNGRDRLGDAGAARRIAEALYDQIAGR